MARAWASASSSRRRMTAPIARRSTLKKAGVGVAQIVDLRPETEGSLADAARAAGIEIIAAPRSLASNGRLRVKAVRIRHPGGDRTLACDALLMSGGWTPSVHLFSQSRGKLVFDEALAALQAGSVGSARAIRRRLQRGLRSCRGAQRGRRSRARGGGGGRLRRGGSANLRGQRQSSGVGRLVCCSIARRSSIVARKPSSTSRTTSAPRM